MVERFDDAALTDEAAIRALWLLYKRGQWGLLSDLGVYRTDVEGMLKQFELDNLVLDNLNKSQCKNLTKRSTAIAEAGTELTLHYFLIHLENKSIPSGRGSEREFAHDNDFPCTSQD